MYFICIAGSSKGRTSLSESENFGSIPSPAAMIIENSLAIRDEHIATGLDEKAGGYEGSRGWV